MQGYVNNLHNYEVGSNLVDYAGGAKTQLEKSAETRGKKGDMQCVYIATQLTSVQSVHLLFVVKSKKHSSGQIFARTCSCF